MGEHRRTLIAIAAAVAFPWLTASAGSDPVVTLSLAKKRILANVDHALDYACTQTVVRNFYRPMLLRLPRACPIVMKTRANPTVFDAVHLFSFDRLRLDVIMTSRGESFAWVGASRFEDAGIDAVVLRGPIGTGAFGGFLAAVFGSDAKQYEFAGEEIFNGKNALKFLFRVPQSDSHYKVKSDGGWFTAAYSGSIVIDRDTNDVLQLNIETAELPESVHSCQSSATLEFAPVVIGSSPLLLPTSARSRFIYPTGDEAVNVSEFANCHEYRSESVITFAPSPEAPANAGVVAPAERPPAEPGLNFSTELLDPIDTDQAAAGDRFRARLAGDLRDKKHHLIAKSGSIVEGRLRRVERFVKSKQIVVVMAPNVIVAGKVRIRVAAILEWTYASHLYRSSGPQRGTPIFLPQTGDGPSGLFPFKGEHVVIKKGFRSDWRTTAVLR